MGFVPLYAVGIREALASNDLSQMKAIAEQAKKTIKEHGDLSAALIELQDAIGKLEK